MQAVILAAGMGKRLGDLTKGNTKCMIQVGNETLISRVLHQLDKQPISRIVLVVGYKAQELKDYLATLSFNTPIEFVENTVYDQTNNIYSLYLAKDYLTTEDTLLYESDLIMEDAVIEKLLNHPYPDLALVDKYESWMDGTVVTIDEETASNASFQIANSNTKIFLPTTKRSMYINSRSNSLPTCTFHSWRHIARH